MKRFTILSKCGRLLYSLLFVGIVLTTLTRCASEESVKEDPESLFQAAEASLKDGHYIIAIERFRDIKNRFPYSSRATDAELRIADTYFEQESFLEAESAYEIFKELHPTHPKIDYVQYRIGLSYFNQIPDNSARDLSAAYHAIEAFEVLIQRYPSSSFVTEARNQILESRRRLAEHENYVANFYFQRKHYLSASYRYAALLKEFPGLGYDEEALARLGQSYFNIKMFGNAKDAATRLVSEFPSSSFRNEGQSLLDELKKKND